MNDERSQLAIFTILITVIGIIVLIFQQAIGLTIIFLAMLVFAIALVRRRLLNIGAEEFALGSIIVWVGFFLTGLPLIAYAWEFLRTSIQVVLFGSGLFLIFVGYSTEYYDLNVKFLKFLRTLKSNLAEILDKIRARLFRSVWTILAGISAVFAILSLLSSSFDNSIPNLLGIQLGVFIEFTLISILSLAIEFRKAIWIVLEGVGRFLLIFLEALWIRIKNIPKLIRDLFQFIRTFLVRFLEVLWDGLLFFKDNIYLLGFLGMIIFAISALIRSDYILGASAIILLLISLMNLLQTRSEEISNRVGDIQQSAYRRSFTIRNLIRRSYSGNCPQCSTEVPSGAKYCRNCGAFIPDCLVCKNTIYEGDETLTCSNCEYVGHAEHIERWLEIKPICPNCRTEWI